MPARKSKCAPHRYSYDGSYEPRLCPRACWTFNSAKYTPMIWRSFFLRWRKRAAGGRQRRLYLSTNSKAGRESLIFSVHINRNIVRNTANSWCLERCNFYTLWYDLSIYIPQFANGWLITEDHNQLEIFYTEKFYTETFEFNNLRKFSYTLKKCSRNN